MLPLGDGNSAAPDWVYPTIGVVALLCVIVVVVLLIRYCRNKSGMEGTYNPNKEEHIKGAADMEVKQKPNLERYI